MQKKYGYLSKEGGATMARQNKHPKDSPDKSFMQNL